MGSRRRGTLISRRKPTGSDRAGFRQFKLRAELLRALEDADFREPRPIQAEAIPPALEGRDVLGLAQTGTGKTAAFVLPILQRLLSSKGKGPRALVVTPTRELAAQVHADFERLAAHTDLTATIVIGGVSSAQQERALQRRPDVIVACPGRLLDLVGRRKTRLDGVEVLVLDEADHMFDMGFLPDVRRILRELPRRRQNLLFSATMPREIRRLADNVLNRPAVVELANSRPADTVEHELRTMSEGQKGGALDRLLKDSDFRSAIVFTRTKRRAKRLAEKLVKRGRAAVALQGNMSQGQRSRALEGFRDGSFEILVATDIAARGLDIAGVSHVINFDVPNTLEAYTHRIGRTGRSGMTGKAITFATHEDEALLRAIEKRLGHSSGARSGDQARSDGRSRGTDRGGRSGARESKQKRRSRPQQSSGRSRGKAASGPSEPRRPQGASSKGARPTEKTAAPRVADGTPFGAGVI